MLLPEQVRPTCIYWANRFQSKFFEFDELYNVAYIVAIEQQTVLTLQKRVRGELIDFMKKRSKFTSQCQPFENDNLNSGDENPLALSIVDKELQRIINFEELLKIIDEANLDQSTEFLQILKLHFVDNMTQEEIAKNFNVSQQVVSNRFNAIMERLTLVNERRMLCQR
jgi:DNA-directed RNA polymerase specialized sigma24 family protein